MALALWRRESEPATRPRAVLSTALAAALVVGGGLSTLFAPAAGAQTATAFTTAEVAPNDALVYIQVPLDESSAQWNQAKALLDRAGLLAPLEESVGSEMEGLPLDAFLGGEAAVVVTADAVERAMEANPMAAGDPMTILLEGTPEPGAAAAANEPQGWAIVLDARAPDTTFAGLTGAIEDQAQEAGVQPEQTEYNGVTITSAPAVPGDDADDSGDTPLAAARVDRHVLIASQPADLEPLIETAQGTTPSLETIDAFGAVQAALPGEHLLFGFVNGPAAMAAQSSLAAMGLPAFAAGSGNYGGFSISADQPGFRMETVEIGADGQALPAGQPNFVPELPGKTPADALFFLDGTNLAATGALDMTGAALIGLAMGQMGGGVATPAPGESPDAYVAEQYEQLAGLLGFNLQTDLLQQLTGEYALWARGTDASTISGLFVSGVGDPATVANALTQLNMLIQGGGGGESNVSTRTVDGSTVNVIETGPGAPSIEYGVVGDELLIGVGNAVDEHALGPAQALADDAQYQAVMGTLPEERNSTLYVNLAQIIPLLQAGASDAAAGLGAGSDGLEDASPNCANYATQEEAQAAYDANEEGTFDLDQNFNGVVCEDFFAAASPEAGAAGMDDAAAAFESVDLSAIQAFALAGYEQDGTQRTSSILYIAE